MEVQAVHQCKGITGRHFEVPLTVWLLIVLLQAEIKPVQMFHLPTNFLMQIYGKVLRGSCWTPSNMKHSPLFWIQGQNNTKSSWCAKFLSFPSLFTTSLMGHLTLRQWHGYRVRSRLAGWSFPQVNVFDAMIKVVYVIDNNAFTWQLSTLL